MTPNCGVESKWKQDRQCTYNVTLWGIRVTIMQWKHNRAFCLCVFVVVVTVVDMLLSAIQDIHCSTTMLLR